MTNTGLRLTSYILSKASQINESQIRLRAHLLLTTLNVLGLNCLEE